MAPVVPRTTFATPNDAHEDALPLVTSPPRESHHRPSDLKPSPPTDCPSPEPFEDNDDKFHSLQLPSPTYQLMFTPTFLMASYDSHSDDSDGCSNNAMDPFVFKRAPLPPWTSAAEHIKPVVNRLIDEERRRHDSVRLAWYPTLPATPTASAQSLSASLGFDPSSVDALETQSSSWVPCLSPHESPSIDSHEMPLLRRTQSLPNLVSGSSPPAKKFVDFNTAWSRGSVYSSKDKQGEIIRWAAEITFTP